MDILKEGYKNKKSQKKLYIIIPIIIVVLIIAGIVGYSYYKPSYLYNKAMQSFNDGNYDIALAQFEGLEDYRDSRGMVLESKYNQARILYAYDKYDESISLYEELGNYKNSSELNLETKYFKAKALFESGEFEKTLDLLDEIPTDDKVNELRNRVNTMIKYQGTWMADDGSWIIFKIFDVFSKSGNAKYIYEQIVKLYPINEEGNIYDKPTIYYKKSDSTDIPKYKVEIPKLIPSPQIGMTAQEVKESTWGKPDKINKTTTKYGIREQWVYYNNKYVYLDDGIVTAIQE